MSFSVKKTEYRFERKFLLEESKLDDFKLWLKTQVPSFREAYPKRKISNIYFDNLDFDAFEDNVSGVSDRCKLRVRWYDDNKEKAYLELKIKKKELGKKIIASIENQFDFSQDLEKSLIELASKLPIEFQKYITTYSAASAMNCYVREYYENFSGVRITIDSKQESKSLISNFFDDSYLTSSFYDYLVVEVKYPIEFDVKELNFLNTIPLIQTKNSKYINAKRFF